MKTKLIDGGVNANGRRYSKKVMQKIVNQFSDKTLLVFRNSDYRDLKLSQVIGHVTDVSISGLPWYKRFWNFVTFRKKKTDKATELMVDAKSVTEDGEELFDLIDKGHCKFFSIGTGSVNKNGEVENFKLKGIGIEPKNDNP